MATKRYINAETRIWNGALSNVASTQRKLLKIYTDARKSIEAEIALLNQKLITGQIKSTAFLNRKQQILTGVIQTIAQLKNQEDVIIKRGFISTWQETYLKTGFNINVESATQYGYSFQVPLLPNGYVALSFNSEVAGQTFKDRSLVKRILLRSKLRNSVSQALVEGIAPDTLAKRLLDIKSAFDSGTAGYNSAKRTARTELLKAYSLGQEESIVLAEDAGIEGKKIWDSTLDGRTRPMKGTSGTANHRIMDQKVKPK